MKAWVLRKGATSLDDLHLVERDVPRPGWGEVLIRVRACSLNFRDSAIVRGVYIGGPVAEDIVPFSDGAGEIVGLGDGVHDLALGDRVAGIFFQHWLEGPPNPGVGPALGAGGANGMLAEYVVLPAQGVIRIARTLSFEEAACLPCAGVTAWNALMCGPSPVKAGDNVLVLGTGGVSLMALQIAKAAGARVVATSSSAGKQERVAALGADATVNYRDNPQWGVEAATHTNGGFEHVVEVGGAGTLAQSIAAVGFGGEIALIGVLTRDGDTSPHGLMLKGASLRGIFVGSKAMALELNAFIDSNRIRPVVDRVFPMAQVKDAFAYQSSPDLFGKVVIAL
ncbi:MULTISPECIES: zinc-dependent alcohol dehydrogenase family protein [unclassified Novosphingobium]|uniref:zinc-dependent alcohol dehydrogenase family protein n=1 Tax=unclassified Novosphingobium TaxID=2644732 RepID=UPI0008687D4B|nr:MULTISPECIES: NAD(P)-dependent alcohol dehydrogenase [unclassified Novosphingobium]MBN9146046.1 NAD(P)-dependent alcohol dehydrogenase [Novosphingobium sp.]MDR6709413.1 NADPH:quinone reductase-like Zn-dependent oxidoreductase [Novosphingobium sp. 1748]ODU80215.1 MAG: NADPH:quinone oxidoreductase [Novosphingobium sp. SCN 63-17]OJX94141.1 MAG: NAD(P)-dependent alcohol dehydrogenase [Novosphingobium sp. 63-713]